MINQLQFFYFQASLKKIFIPLNFILDEVMIRWIFQERKTMMKMMMLTMMMHKYNDQNGEQIFFSNEFINLLNKSGFSEFTEAQEKFMPVIILNSQIFTTINL
jgi:hypothetical protein